MSSSCGAAATQCAWTWTVSRARSRRQRNMGPRSPPDDPAACGDAAARTGPQAVRPQAWGGSPLGAQRALTVAQATPRAPHPRPTCPNRPNGPRPGTITVNDSLDLLAEFMGVGDAVAAVTNKARQGLHSCLGRRRVLTQPAQHAGRLSEHMSKHGIRLAPAVGSLVCRWPGCSLLPPGAQVQTERPWTAA